MIRKNTIFAAAATALLLLASCGYAVPKRFGHAPSTPRRH